MFFPLIGRNSEAVENLKVISLWKVSKNSHWKGLMKSRLFPTQSDFKITPLTAAEPEQLSRPWCPLVLSGHGAMAWKAPSGAADPAELCTLELAWPWQGSVLSPGVCPAPWDLSCPLGTCWHLVLGTWWGWSHSTAWLPVGAKHRDNQNSRSVKMMLPCATSPHLSGHWGQLGVGARP